MSKVAKIMALDVGAKRVGIAISRGLAAEPLKTVERTGGRAEREILKLVKELGIELLIVGLPLNEDGSPSKQGDSIALFSRRIEKRSNLRAIFIDEYSSTYEAKERLGLTGRNERKAREDGLLDAASAAIILEDYLRSSKSL